MRKLHELCCFRTHARILLGYANPVKFGQMGHTWHMFNNISPTCTNFMLRSMDLQVLILILILTKVKVKLKVKVSTI